MTPKEKAEELVEKFRNLGVNNYEYKAKRCALIAADEAINMFIGVHNKLIQIDMLKGDVEETATYIFWKEVKQEIEKL